MSGMIDSDAVTHRATQMPQMSQCFDRGSLTIRHVLHSLVGAKPSAPSSTASCLITALLVSSLKSRAPGSATTVLYSQYSVLQASVSCSTTVAPAVYGAIQAMKPAAMSTIDHSATPSA
eukprot:10601-Heterococcus_DN1.PRE.2